MFLVYSLLLTLGVILSAPYYLWRRGDIGALSDWRERFGHLPESLGEKEPGAVWIHAVSVGETLAVAGLARALRRLEPERKIYLSHVTAAGRKAGEMRLPDLAGRFFLPLDWRWSVRRVFRRLRPSLLLVAETELWPNLLCCARESGARVIVVNARLSDRSFRGYRLIRPLIRRVLGNVDRICAQSAGDAERFRLLGAPADRVRVAGNLKFDALPPQVSAANCLKMALAGAPTRPVMIAGSTMPGEEPLVLEAWNEIRARHPRALLILAPRHPQRFEEVARLLEKHAGNVVRRTALPSDEAARLTLASREVLLLDTIGELAGVLELADVVFVGGSLVATGGHNLIEPAYWSKPIVFGPHMENFADIARLFLEAAAAVQVRDAQHLAQTVLELLADDTRRRELGERARKVMERESGATERVLECVKDVLAGAVSGQELYSEGE